MRDLIESFSTQLIEGQRIGENIQLTHSSTEIRNILLLGMGGSAFGGELTKNIIASTCSIPFVIGRSYDVPAWVNEHTLVIASSYSGNTEETLSAMKMAWQKKARLVCITSGGAMKQFAEEYHVDCIHIPSGYPPRSAVAYSFVPQLYILRHVGLLQSFEPTLAEAIQLVQHFSDIPLAEKIAKNLKDSLSVFYSSPDFESIAIRARQQINENAKQLVIHHCIPEMNHNELVGWEYPKDFVAKAEVVLFRSHLDHPRVALRFDLNKALLQSKGVHVTEIYAQGDSKLAQLMYLLHLSDWISLFLAEANGVDPTPVLVIDSLKSALAKD